MASATLSIHPPELQLVNNTITAQLTHENTILGKVTLAYRSLPEMNYLYIDIEDIIVENMKNRYDELLVELIPIGVDKHKSQRVIIKRNEVKENSLISSNPGTQNYLYDTSRDLVVC